MEFDEKLRVLYRLLSTIVCMPVSGGNEACESLVKHFEAVDEYNRPKLLFYLILNTNIDGMDKYLEDLNIPRIKPLPLHTVCDVIVKSDLVNALSEIVCTCPTEISVEILHCLHKKIFQTENKYVHCRKLALALHNKYNHIIHSRTECDKKLFDVFLMFLPCLYKSQESLLEDALLDINCQLQIWRDCLTCRRISDNPAFNMGSINAMNFLPKVIEVKAPVGRTGESFSDFLSDLKKFAEDSGIFSREGDLPLKKTICENAYFLYETIKNENILKPDEEKWLTSIMREPEKEKITEFDIDEVIDKISKCETDGKWFKVLINFPNWLEKEEALSCVTTHLNVLDFDDLKTVMECMQCAKRDAFGDEINNLYVSCLERMPLKEQMFYFNRHFEEKRNFYWETNEEELTEKFNKLSETDGCDGSTKSWLILTCIRSPSRIITKLCESALSSEAALRRCVEYLKMLRGACLLNESEEEDTDVITSVLKSIIESEDLTSLEKRYLVHLVGELLDAKFLDFKFVNLCILNVIRKCLIVENFEKLIFALELFKSSLKWKSVMRSKEAVLAAFTVRVLSHASWDCSTFSMQLVHARELLVAIAESLIKSSVNFNDLEKAWLRREILNSSEINQLYFCDFLFPGDSTVIASKDLYIQLLALPHTKTKVHSIIDSIVTKFQSKKYLELRVLFNFALIKILPILTAKEWTTLFTHLTSIIATWSNTQQTDPKLHSSLAVVDLLTFSLYCLAKEMNRYSDMSACFEFCLRNYGRVIQLNFPSDEEFGTDVLTDLAKKILFLLNGIEDSSARKTNSMILSSIFLGITSRRGGNATWDEHPLADFEEWFKRDFIQQ